MVEGGIGRTRLLCGWLERGVPNPDVVPMNTYFSYLLLFLNNTENPAEVQAKGSFQLNGPGPLGQLYIHTGKKIILKPLAKVNSR